MKRESTNSTQAAPAVQKPVARKSMTKRLVKFAAAALTVWVLAFTVVWSYVTDLGIHWMYEIATSMDSDPPDFRVYVKQSKVLRGLCDASNWVADKTRPIVSDEVLVALWEAKHAQWEELIRNAKPGNTDLEKTNPELARASGLTSIYNFSDLEDYKDESPISMEISDRYGRLRSGRACNGKGGYLTKSVMYYKKVPPLEYEGRAIDRFHFNFYKQEKVKRPWIRVPGIKLVTDTDLEADEYEVARKLNDRWFIVHTTLND